jgi:hypothetical protein
MKRINKIMADEPAPKRRKRTSAKQLPPGVDNPKVPFLKLDGVDHDTSAIRALIQAALKENIDKQNHIRESEDNSKALISTISEFLDCFVILGYDQESDPVVITYGPTSKDNDALRNLYIKFLPQFMQSQDDLGDPEDL